MKRAFIIHRWDGKPEDDWYPWLKAVLEKKSYQVFLPAMPQTEAPTIDIWVNYLKQMVGKPTINDIFIGHSIGCQTILRFLESEQTEVNAVYLVAPWMNLENLEDKESETIAKPWIETPINWECVKYKAGKFIAWLSDNDPWVPITEASFFESNLNAKIHIEPNQGHFTDDDGITTFPKIMEEL